MPEYPHGEARYSCELEAGTIPGISEVSKEWRHCASVSAAAPHSSVSHACAALGATSQDSRPQNRSMLGFELTRIATIPLLYRCA